MGFLLFQQRKLLITQMKADLNLRLSIISSRITRMTQESTELAEEKAKLQTSQLSSLIDSETGAITADKLHQIIASSADLDVRIQLNDLKEEEMDAEFKNINSQLQHLVAEEEEIDKALNTSIKNSFGALSGK